jgi:membrane protease YdiL (CAAX protease family)
MANSTATTVHPPSLFWKIIKFPLTQITLGTLCVGIGVVVALVIISLLEQVLVLHSPYPFSFDLLEIILTVLAAYLGYTLYVHMVEQRPMTELARQDLGKSLGLGLLLGICLVTLVIGILWVLGVYHVTGLNDWSVLKTVMVDDLPSAFIQILLLLGILFRITERALGTWLALLITVFLFGLLHFISVPLITIMDIFSILLGGLLFAATYLLTRTLWFPIALFIAWEVTLDGIFGVGATGTSGIPPKGLLQAHLTGPVWLTGGAFGAQASIVTIVVILAACIYLIARTKQAKQLAKPFWK